MSQYYRRETTTDENEHLKKQYTKSSNKTERNYMTLEEDFRDKNTQDNINQMRKGIAIMYGCNVDDVEYRFRKIEGVTKSPLVSTDKIVIEEDDDTNNKMCLYYMINKKNVWGHNDRKDGDAVELYPSKINVDIDLINRANIAKRQLRKKRLADSKLRELESNNITDTVLGNIINKTINTTPQLDTQHSQYAIDEPVKRKLKIKSLI
jgi:hypothetical protein